MRFLIASILLLGLIPCRGQSSANKLTADLTNFKMGTYFGSYRGRTPETNGPFNQGIALVGQIYFPFQVSYGKTETTEANEYNNKIILLRSSVIIHLVDNGAIAYGGGAQISFRTIKQFYLEYQLGIVYLEAKEGASLDLHDGMNLHHFVNLSKPLSKHFTASLGFIHLSKGGFNSKTSNQDLIALGLKVNLQ